MGTVILADVIELETIKFSELQEVTSVDSTDIAAVVKDGITSKISPPNLVTGAAGFTAPTELTISSGIVTVSGDIKFRFHSIDTESDAATDDLETINGGSVGDELILQAESDARTVVCKNGASLGLQSDFSLNNTKDKLVLLCISSGVWHELTRASNGA